MSRFVNGVESSSEEDDWPDRLRLGVRRILFETGVSRAQWVKLGLDVHHVVAAGLDAAQPSRVVMARWSVSVHHFSNAAILPRAFHQGQGLHRQAYLEVVNRRLASADAFAEAMEARAGIEPARLIIIKTIQQMGNELVLRSGAAVALKLQSALQQHMLAADAVPERAGRRRSGRSALNGAQSRREPDYGSAGGAGRGDEGLLVTRGPGFPLAATRGRCEVALERRGANGRKLAGAEAYS